MKNYKMSILKYAGRFDVHENTIIRTEESRAIGAKFLDNADLGSREECLRLCCETEFCDVFVFEEKVYVIKYHEWKYLTFDQMTLYILYRPNLFFLFEKRGRL